MTIELNHVIVPARDLQLSRKIRFTTEAQRTRRERVAAKPQSLGAYKKEEGVAAPPRSTNPILRVLCASVVNLS
jgi:hypothetical protein